MATHRLPTFYISHGGGPWPWMTGPMHDAHHQLAVALQALPQLLPTAPRAVLMISAHWEEADFTVQSHPNPPMVYDYFGFPPNTYEIQYPAPGAPALASQVLSLLQGVGIAAQLDAERGFDHGMYVPMAVAWPRADMPVIQLSLKRGLDPQAHLAAGRALAPLRDDGVLVLGSGASYHNLRARGPEAATPSAAFDRWLQQTLEGAPPEARNQALVHWQAAPGARQSHPREEHLLPLMVAVGAAERDAATRIYHETQFFGTTTVSSFMFGPAA